MNLRLALKDKLSEEEIEVLNRSFEVIGDIGIVELDDRLLAKKQEIAKTLAEVQKSIKIVLRKTEDVGGKYRVPEFEIIYMDEDRDFSWIPKDLRPKTATETVHREHGCRFKIDPTKAYFSGKLSGERDRIRQQVKGREKILCLFAGVGPFPIVIAKTKDVQVTAVEINPKAVEYFQENIRMNKVSEKINILEGDAGTVLPTIKGKFDRILMPAPKNASDFLEGTLEKAKKGTIVHLYTFAPEEDIDLVGKKVEERSKLAGKKIKVRLVKRCGNIGPYHYRVVVDFEVL